MSLQQDGTGLFGSCCAPARDRVSPKGAAQAAALFKVLADPVRLRLLALIADRAGGEVCVCELVDCFDLTQPTISHHLKVLRGAGLIDCQRRGTWVYYWAVPGALDQADRVVDALAVPGRAYAG